MMLLLLLLLLLSWLMRTLLSSAEAHRKSCKAAAINLAEGGHCNSEVFYACQSCSKVGAMTRINA